MLNQFNIHEAKTNLSHLLAKVDEGEEVIIARAGEPQYTINLYKKPKKRKLGIWEGKDFYISPDFDEEDSEFYDNPIFPQ